jgi:AcrR family transcriptional regulator
VDTRREEIVLAASALAAERGPAAVTVRAVAARAGIGASTLRHYFPTQRELYHAMVGPSFHAQLDDRRIHDATVPAAERLSECMAQFLPADDTQIRQLEGWLALYASALGPTATEGGAQLLESLQQHARDRVDGWLEILKAEGALQPGGRARHVTTLLAMIDGLCLDLLVARSLTTVTEARAILLDVITGLVVETSR